MHTQPDVFTSVLGQICCVDCKFFKIYILPEKGMRVKNGYCHIL